MAIRINKLLCFIVFLLSGVFAFAQQEDALVLLTKVENHYKALGTYEFDISYKMYRGFIGTTVTEKYSGTIYQSGDTSYTKILGSEIIQFPIHKIIIDTSKKTLTYNNTKGKDGNTSPLSMASFLAFFKEAGRRSNGSIIELELVPKNSKIATPYQKIEIYIDKTTNRLKKQVLYFNTKMPFVDKTGKEHLDNARMEVLFNHKNTTTPRVLKIEDYISISPSGNINLKPEYKRYTLIDQTKTYK